MTNRLSTAPTASSRVGTVALRAPWIIGRRRQPAGWQGESPAPCGNPFEHCQMSGQWWEDQRRGPAPVVEAVRAVPEDANTTPRDAKSGSVDDLAAQAEGERALKGERTMHQLVGDLAHASSLPESRRRSLRLSTGPIRHREAANVSFPGSIRHVCRLSATSVTRRDLLRAETAR